MLVTHADGLGWPPEEETSVSKEEKVYWFHECLPSQWLQPWVCGTCCLWNEESSLPGRQALDGNRSCGCWIEEVFFLGRWPSSLTQRKRWLAGKGLGDSVFTRRVGDWEPSYSECCHSGSRVNLGRNNSQKPRWNILWCWSRLVDLLLRLWNEKPWRCRSIRPWDVGELLLQGLESPCQRLSPAETFAQWATDASSWLWVPQMNTHERYRVSKESNSVKHLEIYSEPNELPWPLILPSGDPTNVFPRWSEPSLVL